VTDAWFPPGLGLPPHEHERAVIAVTLDGGWNSVMLRRPYECSPGTLLVEPAGERHSNQFGTCGGRVVIVQPHASAIEAFERVRPALERPRAPGLVRRSIASLRGGLPALSNTSMRMREIR
jgi:hypothetical protein